MSDKKTAKELRLALFAAMDDRRVSEEMLATAIGVLEGCRDSATYNPGEALIGRYDEGRELGASLPGGVDEEDEESDEVVWEPEFHGTVGRGFVGFVRQIETYRTDFIMAKVSSGFSRRDRMAKVLELGGNIHAEANMLYAHVSDVTNGFSSAYEASEASRVLLSFIEWIGKEIDDLRRIHDALP